ncbi:MAG TPA: MXAN_6640 family putative metalloprotease [Candidatus Limnocylindria bacterium]|nr:MXAN_6640 family putative metalloprotease [Candidatus Limnocylindria bacterium]
MRRPHAAPWLAIGIALLLPASLQAATGVHVRSHHDLEWNAGPSIRRIDAAVVRGEIGTSEAARQKLFYLFDRPRMSPELNAEGDRPAKCGTAVLAEIGANLESFDAETRALYHRYVDAPAPDETHVLLVHETTHFYIEYNTTGGNAVPLADVNPANGIPDFVEWTATSCELSWTVEVDNLGYLAPQLAGGPNNKYLIQFQAQGSYGYTSVVSGQRTRIVLHPSYLGFPPNEDPEGDQIGALRVTVAHELKHAIQRMYTLWAEGGWVELDATWVEDIVYDVINDYYTYVEGPGSPFTEPQTGLDSGGTGLYEDCNWQHYQTELLGNTHMRNFWLRRQANPGEAVLTTYAQNLVSSGSTFLDAWGEYVAWNIACGLRASTGYGYGEAATYPTTPVTSTHTTLPIATTGGTVNHLAANTQLISNAEGTLAGHPEFTFTGAGGIAWSVSILLHDLSGAVTRVPMPLTGGAGTLLLSTVEWANLRSAALVIGNASTSGAAASYTFSARTEAPVFLLHQRPWNTIDVTNPYPITARLTAGTATPDPSSMRLNYRVDGGGLTTLTMTPTVNPDEYTANIPAQPVGSTIEYRISGASTVGDSAFSPALTGAFHPFEIVTVFEPFESAGSWTVGAPGDAATTGVWERVVPIETIAAPGADFTIPPGTTCFVTQNGAVGGAAGAADVDGGATTLLSPVFALGAGGPYDECTARYRRWYSNHLGGAPGEDVWRVDVSNDGGSSWTNVETTTLGNNLWTLVNVKLLTLFGTPNDVRFRFVAEDAGAGSLIEAGVDDFEIVAVPKGTVAVGDGSPRFVSLGPAQPNPSRGAASVLLTLPAPARVSAVVRDVHGRRVRHLVPNGTTLAAGHATLRWDGRAENGARSSSGVYFVQVSVGREVLERRIVLLQ